MIYVACGSLMMAVGLIWLISPAKKPNRLYGYLSYLSQTNQASFKFAQKRSSLYFLLFGFIQIILGLAIHMVHFDRFFMLWLLTFYIFPLLPMIFTEKSLKKFLAQKGELPHDYVDPDKVKHQKTKGFKD
ncbi:MAG: SdpI family protein [Candidatus Lactobacillus pullistercoris]|uniref:SdpI family protein n=1 Tax=Candidatus Lactobacillus pullistercoris TaxID=2838636 RepID=A0A9E2KR25_9LACO|nr:SdpI family protein [Candidatus Lactobacillus pullistercoris]